MIRDADPKNEGHTREWADRARVDLDSDKDSLKDASPKQSPVSGDQSVRDERKSRSEPPKDDSVY